MNCRCRCYWRVFVDFDPESSRRDELSRLDPRMDRFDSQAALLPLQHAKWGDNPIDITFGRDEIEAFDEDARVVFGPPKDRSFGTRHQRRAPGAARQPHLRPAEISYHAHVDPAAAIDLH